MLLHLKKWFDINWEEVFFSVFCFWFFYDLHLYDRPLLFPTLSFFKVKHFNFNFTFLTTRLLLPPSGQKVHKHQMKTGGWAIFFSICYNNNSSRWRSQAGVCVPQKVLTEPHFFHFLKSFFPFFVFPAFRADLWVF